MRSRRLAAMALALVFVQPIAYPLVQPFVRSPAARAATEPTARVIAVLTDQVDPAAVRRLDKVRRRTALERALRAKAAETQRGLIEWLWQRRAEGRADDIEPLWILNAVAVTAPRSVVAELAVRPEVRSVLPDRSFQAPAPMTGDDLAATAEPGEARINATALWELGLRGEGAVVANMDTGVDVGHPDLAGRWRGGANSWYDPYGEHPATPVDVNGHGTATMGVMVGGDAGGTSIGVAPAAQWIAVKAFNDRGIATSLGIHRGLQWLLDPDGDPDTADAPDVVNNSWTASGGGCDLDFQLDLRQLRAAGILPVFAAGNYGPTPGTVFSPANLPEAFSVGATDDADVIDPSSGRGPSACGAAVAPRLVAPGVNVHTTDLYGLYVDASGTSLAAPHVAGTLALLLGAFPDLPADRQAAALENGAVDLGPAGPDNDYGYGRLDALAAYRWLTTAPDFTVTSTPTTANVGPGGTASYAISIAGVNGFAGDVDLTLSGLSAAQATWTFTPETTTGGAGTAQLTVATSATIAPGAYPLTVTGTSGGVSRTADITLVVGDFSVAASPAARTATAGTAATFTTTVGALNGFAGDVALSLTGLPPAVGTSSLSPAVVAGAGDAQVTISTSSTAPPGTYPLTITGTSGQVTHSATVMLTVTAPDFALSAEPASISISRRQTAAYTVSAAPVGGVPGAVTLSVTGLPAATSAAFSRNPIGPSAPSTLTVQTTGTTPRGTFNLHVAGTDGTHTHVIAVTLIVR